MSEGSSTGRVRVTSRRTVHGSAIGSLPASELAERTEIGEVLLRSLVRAQLALALRVLVVFGCVLAGLPGLLAAAPWLVDVTLLGVPLPWLLLGVGSFVLLALVGWLYARLAERREREFLEVVDQT